MNAVRLWSALDPLLFDEELRRAVENAAKTMQMSAAEYVVGILRGSSAMMAVPERGEIESVDCRAAASFARLYDSAADRLHGIEQTEANVNRDREATLRLLNWRHNAQMATRLSHLPEALAM